MSKKFPLVSIITPSYNQGEFIEELILSIKNQSYKNVEHIIIDNNSTDNTIDILKKYKNAYNMRWISENDSGMYMAINKGLYKAKGDILAYLNTDDLYFPWTVSVIVEYFNNHPEIELVYGDAVNINIDTDKKSLILCPCFDYLFLIRKNFIPQPTVFFRKVILKKIGFFNENMKLVGDYEYWLRAGYRCKISKINEVLAIDRIHSKSQRQKKIKQLFKEENYIKEIFMTQNRIKKYLITKIDIFRYFLIKRILIIKFILIYLIKKNCYIKKNKDYPWKNIIEYEGFSVISWVSFFLTMIPWLNRKYKGNWFILSNGE